MEMTDAEIMNAALEADTKALQSIMEFEAVELNNLIKCLRLLASKAETPTAIDSLRKQMAQAIVRQNKTVAHQKQLVRVEEMRKRNGVFTMKRFYGTQKAVTNWERVKFQFEQAYAHFVWRTGKPCKEQEFLRHLIRHGSELELRRKKESEAENGK